MENIRRYGAAPFRVAVLHGGPGAAGEMQPLAARLSASRGILEPLQTADTIDGQLEELRAVIATHCHHPTALIGFSWGAWLAFLFAARFPDLVAKAILVGSAPFDAGYAGAILPCRLARLILPERREAQELYRVLRAGTEDSRVLTRFGALTAKADAFDPLPDETRELDIDIGIYRKVWPQAEQLRASGALLDAGRSIRCPGVAIHGDYDPHPARGVSQPLARTLSDFRFIRLENCGHRPWLERQAQETFYRLLEDELGVYEDINPLNP